MVDNHNQEGAYQTQSREWRGGKSQPGPGTPERAGDTDGAKGPDVFTAQRRLAQTGDGGEDFEIVTNACEMRVHGGEASSA
jgi:hypothetical protein